MNKKNMILLSSLLVCSLESFAQNQVEATDSILKDMDLDAVTVVASKPLVKMETDKMTYNVEQDADAKASTVLDMLRKVPMVTVDGQDNITVNGSSSFKVYRRRKAKSHVLCQPIADIQGDAGNHGQEHRGNHQSGSQI